mmetsp:Transcript_4683/g.17666  ORF Transcript_4683/g.17666 Transcript_4683/m.17666 type:complete len:224 (-) Transcript_4683:563-1234(-)
MFTGAPASKACITRSASPCSAAAASWWPSCERVAPPSKAATNSRQGLAPSATTQVSMCRRTEPRTEPVSAKSLSGCRSHSSKSSESKQIVSAGAATAAADGFSSPMHFCKYAKPSLPRTTATMAPSMRLSCWGPKAGAAKDTADQSVAAHSRQCPSRLLPPNVGCTPNVHTMGPPLEGLRTTCSAASKRSCTVSFACATSSDDRQALEYDARSSAVRRAEYGT